MIVSDGGRLDQLHAALVDLALAGDREAGSGTRLICIDGKAGAGKTTLSGRLAAELASRGVSHQIIHMDDLYAGWGGLLTARDVVVNDLLHPLRRGDRARYRHFDWARNDYTHTVTVPEVEVVILEGCGSAPPEVDPVASLVVYVEAPDDLRLARGLDRDGAAARAPWIQFMADEERLALRDRTRERADVVLNESADVLRWPSASWANAHDARGQREDRLNSQATIHGEDR